MARVIRVDFSRGAPQPYWLDKETGQLSFVFDVPSPPIRQVELIRRPSISTYADRVHAALEAREG